MINVTRTILPSLKEYNKYLSQIWKTHWVTNDGDFSKELEEKLSSSLRVKNIALVNNGTIGLLLALKVLKLKGEVITTPFTFPATTNVLLWEGLKPVFTDIDPDTFNIDPDEIERKITRKTSAILAVHVYGNPCDTKRLEKIAKKHNIKLIFDAAHAFNVEYMGKSILSYGDLSVLSFHATKTFHTIEGGAIVTENKKLFEEIKLYRNFGIKSEEEILLPGINAKMNEFQAAMGLSNLRNVENNISKRKRIYELYIKGLSKTAGLRFQQIDASKYNYSYMPVIFETRKIRDKVYEVLLKNNVKARKYFYPLIANLDYVREFIVKHEVPNSQKVSDGVLCLPIYPGLSRKDQIRIIRSIKESLI